MGYFGAETPVAMYICEDCYCVRKWKSHLSGGWADKRRCIECKDPVFNHSVTVKGCSFLVYSRREAFKSLDSTPIAFRFMMVRNYPYSVFFKDIVPRGIMFKKPSSTRAGRSHFYLINDQGHLNQLFCFEDLRGLARPGFGAAKLLDTGEVAILLAPATFVHTETVDGEHKSKIIYHTANINAGGVCRLPDDYPVDRKTWGVLRSERHHPIPYITKAAFYYPTKFVERGHAVDPTILSVTDRMVTRAEADMRAAAVNGFSVADERMLQQMWARHLDKLATARRTGVCLA